LLGKKVKTARFGCSPDSKKFFASFSRLAIVSPPPGVTTCRNSAPPVRGSEAGGDCPNAAIDITSDVQIRTILIQFFF
jgi:hypothetical protein